jgi:Flp pilus assembly CpaE family ATPase
MSFVYDGIGVDKRFKTREFVRFYDAVKHGKSIKRQSNIDEKINWALITPEDIKEKVELLPIEIVRLINNVSGDVVVCDISECKSAEDYLLDMDIVVFVIDPMPSAMIQGYSFMKEVKRLEHNGKKVIWVINKFNEGINKRDMLSFLKLKEYYKIPNLDSSDFYSAQYNCKLPYEMQNIHEHSKETIEKIVGFFAL